MPEIIIPTGSARDGSTLMYVNGEEALVPDYVATNVEDKFINLLTDIDIDYDLNGLEFVLTNGGRVTSNGNPIYVPEE